MTTDVLFCSPRIGLWKPYSELLDVKLTRISPALQCPINFSMRRAKHCEWRNHGARIRPRIAVPAYTAKRMDDDAYDASAGAN